MQPFQGTERFEIRGLLGQGGFGVVYEAYDRAQQLSVALKQVRELDSDAVRRFKHEFRALTDFVHPNLVALYELFSDENTWFFTMEMVDGENYLSWVRPGFRRVGSATFNLSIVSDDLELHSGQLNALVPGPQEHTGVLDEVRLRDCLRQIVVGVSAMHEAGILHRDLKPNNILVTPTGRLVLLDFGLAAEVAARRHGRQNLRIGTPIYMAPETASGAALSESSDWYAVGVLLFEALTGQVPFQGTPTQVLAAKRMVAAPCVRALVPDAPADLADLADGLLERDPNFRPTGAEIRRRTGARAGTRGTDGFVGRSQELTALHAARAEVSSGGAAIALIEGTSGVGKSVLLDRFLGELCDAGDLVFTGRCYERESLPFKALDELVEDLAGHIRGLKAKARQAVQPEHDTEMVRVFPSLFGLFERTSPVDLDEGEIRRRAGLGFRDLVAGLAGAGPAVLAIDDIQWGDADSASMIIDVMRAPNPPNVLIVMSMRPEGVGTPVHGAVRALERQGIPVHTVDVGPLPDADARVLLSGLLGDDEAVDLLAREAGGLPFLLDALARHVREHGVDGVSVSGILQRRMGILPDNTLGLLRLIAVSGRPIERRVLRAASGLPGDHASITRLVREHLVRSEGDPGRERVDTYHDRVRKAVLGGTPDVPDLHRRLADALQELDVGDAERWFVHRKAAGQMQEAGALAVEAARTSAEGLAFDNAARLFGEAIALGVPGAELLEERARALQNAGRPFDAGEAFLVAAEAAGDRAMELRRIAGQQFLAGGHADRGVEVLRPVLAAQGLSLARSPNLALASLLFNRSRLWLRGLDFTLQEDVPEQALRRIDTLWSVASALSVLDSIRATDFQVRHLMAALDAGEPYRISRALALEGVYAVTESAAGLGRSESVLKTARELATQVQHTHSHAMVELSLGMREFLLGRWPESCAAFETAEPKLRLCRDVTWELSQHATWYLDALALRGFYGRLGQEIPPRLSEARQKGNLQLIHYLAYARSCFVAVAEDDPEGGLQRMERTFVGRARHGFTIPDWWRMMGLSVLHAYREDSEAAWAIWEADWKHLRRSLLLRVDVMAVPARYHRARLALARARDTRQGRFLRIASGEARELAKSTSRWGQALGILVRGLVARFEQDPTSDGLLADADRDLMALDMRLHALSARICREVDVTASVDALRSLGMKEPMRVAELFAPRPRV